MSSGANDVSLPGQKRRRTAAGLVIGNEILNGKTLDTNTQTLAKTLFQRGIVLARCETIPDDFDTIRTSLSRLAQAHDYVFTSGGIGPTLDDITYKSVGAAFGVEVALHAETLQRMQRVSPHMEINDARKRMATLPIGCETLWTDGLWVPTVCMAGKVYVLPGVPRLYASMLNAIPERRVGSGGIAPKATARIDTSLSEGDIAASLDDIAKMYPLVTLGSYPSDPIANPSVMYRTRLTLESDDSDEVARAEVALKGAVSAIEKNKADRKNYTGAGGS